MDPTSIASLASSQSSLTLQSEVSMRVLRKSLDSQQQAGQAVNAMLASALKMAKNLASTQPSRDTGLGGSLDTAA